MVENSLDVGSVDATDGNGGDGTTNRADGLENLLGPKGADDVFGVGLPGVF